MPSSRFAAPMAVAERRAGPWDLAVNRAAELLLPRGEEQPEEAQKHPRAGLADSSAVDDHLHVEAQVRSEARRPLTMGLQASVTSTKHRSA